jgi:hypothetical protein
MDGMPDIGNEFVQRHRKHLEGKFKPDQEIGGSGTYTRVLNQFALYRYADDVGEVFRAQFVANVVNNHFYGVN